MYALDKATVQQSRIASILPIWRRSMGKVTVGGVLATVGAGLIVGSTTSLSDKAFATRDWVLIGGVVAGFILLLLSLVVFRIAWKQLTIEDNIKMAQLRKGIRELDAKQQERDDPMGIDVDIT